VVCICSLEAHRADRLSVNYKFNITKHMNKTTMWWTVGLVTLVLGLFGLSKLMQSSDPDTVSLNGLHWHPELTIYADGEKQEIPANIGLGSVHQPIHTHAEDSPQGVLHLEFEGVVREADIKLGNFFRIWGKDMTSDFGTLTKMTVNGEENTEYADYQFQANDKIELFYETGGEGLNEDDTSMQVPAPGFEGVDEMIVEDGGPFSEEG
jgi:hypothetical protein